MVNGEQNDNKHSERKQHINAVIKRSDAMRKTERDIRSAYEDVLFDLRWSVIPRREGGIEVFGGNDGKIVLESEEEVKDLCEAMIS